MDVSMELVDEPKPQAAIDEDLHSRQLAVYGKESMSRMANANVLILGVKGLGVEVGAQHALPARAAHLNCRQLKLHS